MHAHKAQRGCLLPTEQTARNFMQVYDWSNTVSAFYNVVSDALG
jgi:hypothetical protein